MRIVAVIGFLFLACVSLTGRAQDDSDLIDPILIKLQGKIISAGDSLPVPYANILNNRTHSGTTTNADGFFSIEMLNIDSLIVTSIGFERSILKVPANYTGYNTLTFVMLPSNYALREVRVEGDKPKVDLGFETGSVSNVPVELRGDAFNEAPPVLAAFFNPISYWQYYLSKKEKRKREVRKEMVMQKNWEMHSQNYNKEKVMMLTGMNEMEADSFMIWFNSQDVLPYLSSEYQVRATIIEFFHYYKIEKASPNSIQK
ncbi:MAG TPA: carboxypeptidase-like regulatory domain-containing protein [Draconibacterium sp.]|nr:carboxypeptidase-like regulatory domain-containing protein [Draconibacterium sp.]